MIADKILPLLEKVKSTGKDSWVACCPAHPDKTPSMAIREQDERVLLHCFAGCDVYEIVSAVGLEVSDLFPESRESHKPLSRPFPASDILRCLATESLFVSFCAKDLNEGKQLCHSDIQRLDKATNRIYAAVQAGGLR